MRTIFAWSVAIICGVIFFCGEVNTASAAEKEKLRIACIGDSITFGMGLKDPQTEAYPAVLQTLLGEEVEVRGFGNSGRGIYLSTNRGNEKRGFYYQNEHKNALAFNPHFVICNLGINDIQDYRKGNAGDFAEDYVKLLREYAELPTQPTCFIWTRLTPIGTNGKGHVFATEDWAEPFIIQNDLEKVVAQMREKFPHQPSFGLDMETPFSGRVNEFFPDNVHPNAAGAGLIAEETAKVLRPLLRGDFGGLKLATPFTSNMVLPHSTPISMRGTANAEEKIMVNFGDANFQTAANRFGEWSVEIPPQSPTFAPQKLIVKTSKEEIVCDNIVVGEVWLCAGQSNMLWRLNQCDNTVSALGFFDKRNALPLPPIRFLQMKPQNGWHAELPWRGEWEIGNVENAKTFSGVATFFAVARAGQFAEKNAEMPIGLIEVAYGGAPLEAFLSRQQLLTAVELRAAIAHYTPWYDHAKYAPWGGQRAKQEIAAALKTAVNQNEIPPKHMFAPAAIFASALKPLTDFPLTGVLWYQGESNATTCGKPDEEISPAYCETGIHALIADLRQHFPSAVAPRELPILMVQLPRCDRPWANFREVQWRVAQSTPEVETIITTDTGVPNDVHPRDKKVIGERLAAAANRIVNGDETDAIFPCVENVSIAQAGEIIVLFTPRTEIQVVGDAKVGIELFTDTAAIPVTSASLQTENGGTNLSIQFDSSQKPTQIKYNWQNVPPGVLQSARGFPVAPFACPIKN